MGPGLVQDMPYSGSKAIFNRYLINFEKPIFYIGGEYLKRTMQSSRLATLELVKV